MQNPISFPPAYEFDPFRVKVPARRHQEWLMQAFIVVCFKRCVMVVFQASMHHLAEGHNVRVPETPCQKTHFYNYYKDNQPP